MDKSISPTRSVETSDIVLAASLRSAGYSLDKIEKTGNRGVFCFLNVPEEFLTAFDLGQIQVEPQSFNGHIKSLTTATRRMV